MNLREILEAFFLNRNAQKWSKIPLMDKAKLFGYILQICANKDLKTVCKAVTMAQKPSDLSWEHKRALVLDSVRDKFAQNKSSLYQISWFYYPKKIVDKQWDSEAVLYYLKSMGKDIEFSELKKNRESQAFINNSIKEYKKIKKYL